MVVWCKPRLWMSLSTYSTWLQVLQPPSQRDVKGTGAPHAKSDCHNQHLCWQSQQQEGGNKCAQKWSVSRSICSQQAHSGQLLCLKIVAMPENVPMGLEEERETAGVRCQQLPASHFHTIWGFPQRTHGFLYPVLCKEGFFSSVSIIFSCSATRAIQTSLLVPTHRTCYVAIGP